MEPHYRNKPEWVETYNAEWIHHNGKSGFLCRGCGEHFEAHRRDSKYCTNACRLKAYKERPKVEKPIVLPYYTYINILYDGALEVAVKFGIEKVKSTRHITQNRSCVYEVRPHSCYRLPSRAVAYKAETECRRAFDCKIIPKSAMPDGYTETTYCYNIDKIRAIYEKHGGVLLA